MKEKFSVSIDKDLLKWLDDQIKNKTDLIGVVHNEETPAQQTESDNVIKGEDNYLIKQLRKIP